MGSSCAGLIFDRDNEFELTSSERSDLYNCNKHKAKYKLLRRGPKGYEVKTYIYQFIIYMVA